MVYKQHQYGITGPLVELCNVLPNKIEMKIKDNSIKGEKMVIRNYYGIEVENYGNVFWKNKELGMDQL